MNSFDDDESALEAPRSQTPDPISSRRRARNDLSTLRSLLEKLRGEAEDRRKPTDRDTPQSLAGKIRQGEAAEKQAQERIDTLLSALADDVGDAFEKHRSSALEAEKLRKELRALDKEASRDGQPVDQQERVALIDDLNNAEENERDEYIKFKDKIAKAKEIFDGEVISIAKDFYKILARENNPSILIKDNGDSLSPLPKDGAPKDENVDELWSVVEWGTSTGPATRAMNKLLEWSDIARVKEEMDFDTYSNGAERQFLRARQEFRTLSGSFDQEIKNVEPVMQEAAALEKDFDALKSKIVAKISSLQGAGPPNIVRNNVEQYFKDIRPKSNRDFGELLGRLRLYKRFLADERDRIRLVSDDFCSEAAIDSFRHATEDVGRRLDQHHILEKWRPGLAAITAGALAAGGILFFEPLLRRCEAGQLPGAIASFCNGSRFPTIEIWALYVVVLVVATTFVISIWLGARARRNAMARIKKTLRSNLDEILESGRQDYRTAFKFRRWPIADIPGPQSPPTPHATTSEINASGVSAPIVSGKRPAPMALAKALQGVTQRQLYPKIGTAIANCLLVAVIGAAAVLGLPLLVSALASDNEMAFVGRTAEHGSCKLETGLHVGSISGNYYFIGEGKLQSISRATVLNMRRLADVSTLPRCELKSSPAHEHIALLDAVKATETKIDATAAAADAKRDGLADRLSGEIRGAAEGLGKKIDAGVDLGANGGGAPTPPLCNDPAGNCGVNGATLPERLSQLLAANAEALKRVSTPYETTTVPVVVNIDGARTSMAVPDAPSSPVFMTHIALHEGKVVETLDGHELLIPLFPPPVATTDGTLRNPVQAFQYGVAQLETLKNPGIVDAFEQIGRALEICAETRRQAFVAVSQTPKPLRVTVAGFATEDWLDEIDENQKKKKNWYLAEGRRVAALKALKLKSEWIDVGDWEDRAVAPLDEASLEKNFLFDDYGTMDRSLENYVPSMLKDRGLSDEQRKQAKKALSKSVLISVDGAGPTLNCQDVN